MPTIPEAFAIAMQRHQAGQRHLAEQIYAQILQIDPNHPGALHLLGLAASEAGHHEVAVDYIGRALQLAPDYVDAHGNLGNAFKELGRFDEAIACHRRVLELMPDYVEAYSNMGYALFELGKWAEAIANYDRAVELDPNFADAHQNLAVSYLLQGDFERGWRELEWRWLTRAMPRLQYLQPLWDGSPLNGRTILLHAEQGLGDSLQFIRYAPLVHRLGGRVLVECPATLLPLLATVDGIEHLYSTGSLLPPFDVHAPMMSLPEFLGTTSLESIPASVPYLAADPDLMEKWRRRLANVAGFRVGIVWQGNPNHRRDRWRSAPLERFMPLANVPGVSLVSLQKETGSEQLDRFPGLAVDVGPELTDMSETAAAVSQLDLVISVDTAIVHLAGALGTPVWVALPFVPDWRWLLERDDSPWYPTMRLFRQSWNRDWGEVFNRLTASLRELRTS